MVQTNVQYNLNFMFTVVTCQIVTAIMNRKCCISVMLSEEEYIEDNFESSDSSSDEDILATDLILKKHCRMKRVCIKNYNEVVEGYSDEDFLKHFRLRRPVVQRITEQYKQSPIYLDLVKYGNSRAFTVSPEKTILVFLWYAGHHSASFRDVADRFDLCLTTLHDIITRVCAFLGKISPTIIQWPSHERQLETQGFFESRHSIPKIIGCIDGTHIKIDKPTQQHVDYCNRKGFYSVILQGVCDDRKHFISIFIGYPGSTHDARVFKSSTVYERVENAASDFYILGDSAYPLLPHLLTPYRDNGHLSPAQRYFNKKLSSCRVFIEHTFGLLKQRFRQLYHVKLQGHERICKFIHACCVLHNMGSCTDFELFATEDMPPDEQPPTEDNSTKSQTATTIRNQLCQTLYASHLNSRTNT